MKWLLPTTMTLDDDGTNHHHDEPDHLLRPNTDGSSSSISVDANNTNRLESSLLVASVVTLPVIPLLQSLTITTESELLWPRDHPMLRNLTSLTVSPTTDVMVIVRHVVAITRSSRSRSLALPQLRTLEIDNGAWLACKFNDAAERIAKRVWCSRSLEHLEVTNMDEWELAFIKSVSPAVKVVVEHIMEVSNDDDIGDDDIEEVVEEIIDDDDQQ